MPNLSTILKGEITRLARKEIKAAIDPVRKANAGHRKEIVELKRVVASLQRDLKAASKPAKARAAADEESTSSSRFSAKGLKSLRAKLGLSAAEFGQLVGASGQSIYNWETGKAVPRASQQASLVAIRGIGKRAAAKRLAGMV
ncbi:helix-turn-helix domain-containing protein [Thermomonas sp.]|uniref:helix-turn-helix domain-containing protein n=1 Tax=Thermomonas sp. TaxID=1971895 RepID=UPI0035AF62A9